MERIHLFNDNHIGAQMVRVSRSCREDEGRPLEVVIQVMISNRLKLHW